MEPTPRPFALVFDVDGTLAPDTTSQFLATRGVDVDAFWSRAQTRMREGGDPVRSYIAEFLAESEGPHGPFTRAAMAAAAPHFTLYPGVSDLLERLSGIVAARGMVAEYYLVSGGLAFLVRNLPIAQHCAAIWAAGLEFDRAGQPTAPGDLVAVTDKRRALLAIARGAAPSDPLAPTPWGDDAPTRGFRIPFSRMVFVGDGTIDVPSFSLLSANGGAAVAVYEAGRARAERMARGFQRRGYVGWVAEADYTERGPGFRALQAAIHRLVDRDRT